MPVRGNQSKQNDAPNQQLALVLIPRTSPTPVAHVCVADSNHLIGGRVQAEQHNATGSDSTRRDRSGQGTKPRPIGRDTVKHRPYDGVGHSDVEHYEDGKDEQVDARPPINQCVSNLARRDTMVIRYDFEQHRHALFAGLVISLDASEMS